MLVLLLCPRTPVSVGASDVCCWVVMVVVVVLVVVAVASVACVAVPILNPDGYEYSWTDDRMWRKTRMPNPGSPCVGTDPNRNWCA